jgi:hypothetical protein
VPKWEEYPHTPGVFVRVAYKGDKSRQRTGLEVRPGRSTPLFFVSVASKGLNQTVSLLFATLAGRFISVAAKGLKAGVGSDPDRVGAGQLTVVRQRTGNRGPVAECIKK